MEQRIEILNCACTEYSPNGFYAGGFWHADDIRILATSMESLEALGTMVKDFAARNFLKLNIQKCEAVGFSYGWNTAVAPRCEVDGLVIPFKDAWKYNLGYWWKRDLANGNQWKKTSEDNTNPSFTLETWGLCLLSTRSIYHRNMCHVHPHFQTPLCDCSGICCVKDYCEKAWIFQEIVV